MSKKKLLRIDQIGGVKPDAVAAFEAVVSAVRRWRRGVEAMPEKTLRAVREHIWDEFDGTADTPPGAAFDAMEQEVVSEIGARGLDFVALAPRRCKKAA